MPCFPGMRRCHVRCLHRERVEDYHRARHVQDTRAEAATHGYETELAAYFDPLNGVERRLLFKDWLIETANPTDQGEAA